MALQDRLEELYRDHAPALFRFLIRLTGHEADTRDILQEIFIRLAQTPQLLDGVAAPRSYLFRMAHRLVIDRGRREKTRRDYDDRASRERETVAQPGSLAGDAAWIQNTLAASLDALPPEQKSVVVLKVWEEMTFAQIAAVLDISANTAASRYRYALDKLRAGLRPLHRDLP
ncbi:MAG TPA: sigma-70 family RNA polymerase sigma factor [Candidatus Methylacidiphilales bacterium]|jgi:RNA polymerase sigma-70 factor (ECF subfamily)|nr:sigma-70 family RNA polymerase sigma factor [Candidatus Methylacidiphilales bacterium]